ncbi:MAG: beta-lactamase family protein [Thermomicrobiales bacterium]|nr:beta-lactamase family protein [Thermomicrobiales bacterium]
MSRNSFSRVSSSHVSRRRLLAAVTAATTSRVAGRMAAAQTPAAGAAAVTGPWRDAAAIPATLPDDASPRFRAVADALIQAMAKHGVPGAALGIRMDGQEEHAVFGVANLDTHEPVTSDTLFQAGSITKTFTGSVIMRLIAEGKLDLYAPVRDYLPDLDLEDASVAARVTIRHLMTHTAGWWGDAFFDTGDGDDAIARLVRDRLPELPQLFPLGMFPCYNNAAIVLLGRLIEVATGEDYRSAMQRLLLDPLAMNASTFDPDRVERGSFALGYTSSSDGVVPQSPLYFPRGLDPAGGLWSTTREQLQYARLHVADGVAPDGTRLLPVYTTQLMRRPQARFVGITNIQIGLTWFVQEFGGIRLATHDGHTFGQHSSLLLAPDRGFALILLTNIETGGGGADPAVLTTATRQYLGLGEEAAQVGMTDGPEFAPDAAPLALAPEELAPYAGRYATPNMAITLRVANGQLLLSMENLSVADLIHPAIEGPTPQDVPVSVISGERLAVGSYLIGAIVRRPDSTVGWLRFNILTLPRVSDQ